MAGGNGVAHGDREGQRPELILSIVSACGLRKFALCRELLSLCNFKDF